MTNQHIIIIGAGAAGLMAAKQLSRSGNKVTVLEARDYLGGRIHTLYDAAFQPHAELGAEFIHGDLPVTLSLLKEAGMPYNSTEGEMWQAKDGKLVQEHHAVPHWDLFEKRLQALQEDKTINAFLEAEFSGEKYAGLRESARRYVAGYDTGDPDKASALALRDEWLSEDEGGQHKPAGGYQLMINYLAEQCKAHGGSIHTNAVVTQIAHDTGGVTVMTHDGSTYAGSKVIITLPIGVLQADDAEKGAVRFLPELPEIRNAIQGMGMGAVIKILLQFSAAFWESESVTRMANKSMEKMCFIFSGEAVPTFWTQCPDKSALLTGWMGGGRAFMLKDASDEHILELAIESVANIFGLEMTGIRGLLTAGKVLNWTADPFSRGSYSYATITTKEARKILKKGIGQTICFAGEAMYEGPEMGTVEAALASGQEIAEKINSGYHPTAAAI